MRTKSPGHDVRVAAIAKLAAQGDEQTAIAKRLGISQAAVSRLAREATSKGWLVRSARFKQEAVPPAVLQKLDLLVHGSDVKERLLGLFKGTRLRGIEICDVDAESGHAEGIDGRLREFGSVAASHLARFLERANCVGVTWGTTLAITVGALDEFWTQPPRQNGSVEFIPLCGEPFGYANVSNSSTRIAAQLNAIINGTKNQHALTGVPAFIPEKLAKGGKRKAIDELIRCVPSYAQIFPPRRQRSPAPEPNRFLVERVDTVITSAGHREQAWGFIGVTEWSAAEQFPGIAKLIAGDLGGVLLPVPDLSNADLRKVDHWGQLWTGARRDDLERVAKSSGPGVILFAIGAMKCQVVAESVRQGLVNELVIDFDLADGLVRYMTS